MIPTATFVLAHCCASISRLIREAHDALLGVERPMTLMRACPTHDGQEGGRLFTPGPRSVSMYCLVRDQQLE